MSNNHIEGAFVAWTSAIKEMFGKPYVTTSNVLLNIEQEVMGNVD